MDDDKRGWLTPLEAARQFQVSIFTVWRMCKDGELPDGYQAEKVRHQWRIHKPETKQAKHRQTSS